MNTQRITTWRLDDDIAIVGVPPQGNAVPPLLKVANVDQAPVNPPPLTDSEIRASFIQIV